jgi:hypothetical protein
VAVSEVDCVEASVEALVGEEALEEDYEEVMLDRRVLAETFLKIFMPTTRVLINRQAV